MTDKDRDEMSDREWEDYVNARDESDYLPDDDDDSDAEDDGDQREIDEEEEESAREANHLMEEIERDRYWEERIREDRERKK